MWSSWTHCKMSPTMVAKAANCKTFAWSLAPLLICRSNLNWQTDGIWCNSYGKKRVYLKPPDSVQRPRVSKYGLKTFLCIFWNSSGGLQNWLLETSLMVTPYVNYHKLTKVTNKYCFHFDKTSKSKDAFKTMLVSTRQIKEKLLFYIKLLRLSPLIV